MTAKWSTSSVQAELEKQGAALHGHGYGSQAASTKTSSSSISRHRHPHRRQQVRGPSTTAVWSGGSFVYVPKGVHVAMPLQAYFRINSDNMGQFERTLIIADEGSSVHYLEGCTALGTPIADHRSACSAVVELIAMKGAKIRYTTIQNWSKNVYNLVTKRAFAYEDARVEWIDGNLGSFLTVKYPAIYLKGKGASGEVMSVAYAGKGMHQDAGARIIAFASDTSATVTSKSISKDGGRTSYRGLVRVMPGAKHVHVEHRVRCPADGRRQPPWTPTPPCRMDEKNVNVGHEATVSKIGDEQLFYLTSPRPDGRCGPAHRDRQRLHGTLHQEPPPRVRR